MVSTVVLAGMTGHAAGDCSCVYQGKDLPSSVYTNYPTGTGKTPGQYKNLANIAKYGTMCAAWDQVPGTPWVGSCGGTDFSSSATGGKNWCQLPWCYVGSTCATKVASSVFAGSTTAYYSYAACGNTPDCYNKGATLSTCPYDPNGEKDYRTDKKSCPCLYQGQTLSTTLLNTYPSDSPGKWKNNANIAIYGTTCAQWDQSPNTPWASSCPTTADWCSYDKNWCQLPWCYVAKSCSTAVSSGVFKGSNAAYYSYDTCLSAPNCYTNSAVGKRSSLPAACPYDKNDAQWYTPKVCATWTGASEASAASGVAISGAAVMAAAAVFAQAA